MIEKRNWITLSKNPILVKTNIVRIVGKRSGSPEKGILEFIQETSKWKKLKGFKGKNNRVKKALKNN